MVTDAHHCSPPHYATNWQTSDMLTTLKPIKITLMPLTTLLHSSHMASVVKTVDITS